MVVHANGGSLGWLLAFAARQHFVLQAGLGHSHFRTLGVFRQEFFTFCGELGCFFRLLSLQALVDHLEGCVQLLLGHFQLGAVECVGDTLLRNLAAWDQRVDQYVDDFAVFGSVCEPYEYLWRIIGSENALYWMATDAELLGAFVDRLGKFLVDFARAQIEAGKGRISGMYIWGDVAYVRGMLFGAPRWRELFKPHVKALIDLCRRHNLMTIYHGCGDACDQLQCDCDGNGAVGNDDYGQLVSEWGLTGYNLLCDCDGNNAVGNDDYGILVNEWGYQVGPSGVTNPSRDYSTCP